MREIQSAIVDTIDVDSVFVYKSPPKTEREIHRSQKWHAVPSFDAKARRTKNKAAKKARARNRK